MPSPYDVGLDRNAANHESLTPLSLLEWSASVYPQQVAVVHGARRQTWSETYARCRRLASALTRRGIGLGDTVAVVGANTPEMVEVHFGVPMSGAVLNTINTRLDPATIAFTLEHAEARIVLVDREFSPAVAEALGKMKRPPPVVDIDDPAFDGPGRRLGELDYEALLAEGDPDFAWQPPADEWQAISLNYTSGTTGNPKGVVYHHRGAYLNAIGNALTWGMPRHAVYLWTLPMFHCNGWCFPWTMAAVAGTSVCLRKVDPAAIFALIAEHRVTHYCGAPIVHNTIIQAPAELRAGIHHKVSAMVAGAAPPAAMIEGMERIGFDLIHVYGLTETYGPAAVCAKHEAWSDLDPVARAERNGRQGVRYVLQAGMTVMDPTTMQPVPADGETMGEIMFRGNITMKGYLKNPAATEEAFAGGWFHSGDLAVMQPDGYAKVMDRAKDIIISGGENISSLEVEDALYRHPAVLVVAVVAAPDDRWGEVPCAFVELRPGAEATEAELIAHCREHLARFKAPKKVVFGSVPKTPTGKIQKYVLRRQVQSTDAIHGKKS
ncbi:MAG TPA: acyl-CoA synthetase [Kofleriaceae bacterium]|nr:acyl-CoA synthetase [Kofleriaceae bacterium]